MRSRLCCWVGWVVALAVVETVAAQQNPAEPELASEITEIFAKYCSDCHSPDLAEADIDLTGIVKDRSDQVWNTWQRVRDVVRQSQMPPPDSDPLPDAARQKLLSFIAKQLELGAQLDPGDPGEIPLRRLSNAEFAYAIQDLTQVATLNPTADFPADGAAGEGFSNTGMGQAMSPAMIDKYLEAARRTSDHLVLVPQGLRFSPFTSRRDQVTEIIEQIQQLYRRYTDAGGGSVVNFDGQNVVTNADGRLPLQTYLRVLAEAESSLRNQQTTFSQLAKQQRLSAKYLERLGAVLLSTSAHENVALESLRLSWQQSPRSLEAMEQQIATWQAKLWKFNIIGHLGRQGGPSQWLQPLVPIAPRTEFNIDLAEYRGHGARIELGKSPWSTSVATPHWEQARLVFDGLPAAVELAEVESLANWIDQLQNRELHRSGDYFRFLCLPIDQRPAAHDLDPHLLKQWAQWLNVSLGSEVSIAGHLSHRLENVAGYASVRGWGRDGSPTVLVNQSDSPISFLTLTVPARQVVVHPTPSDEVSVEWRAPGDGQYRLEWSIADQDSQCGNGVLARLEIRSQRTTRTLWQRDLANGEHVSAGTAGAAAAEQNHPQLSSVALRQGEVIALVITAKEQNHACDSTQVQLVVTQIDGNQVWNLADDVVDRIQDGNPVADSGGNQQVWHFCGRVPSQDALRVDDNSLLARLRRCAAEEVQRSEEIDSLALELQRLCAPPGAEQTARGDGVQTEAMIRQLRAWTGPLHWLAVARNQLQTIRSQDSRGPSPAKSWHVNSSIWIPAELCQGARLIAEVALEPTSADMQSADFALPLITLRDPVGNSTRAVMAGQWLAVPNSPGEKRLQRELAELQSLFPPALCYERIVPVDEVVTLTLYHREDRWLQELMLTADESAWLDARWRELWYVAQEPLAKAVAFEQIAEFATQDRPDLVVEFREIGDAIAQQARDYQQQLIADEPRQVAKLIEWASFAWRRSLSEQEQSELSSLYQQLREEGNEHEAAMRLLVARILTAPAFLFKLESTPAGSDSSPVSDQELASRLSFFLWSSLPDQTLIEAAQRGELAAAAGLMEQVERMLRDPRISRLSREFGAQWLQVRNFAEHDEKSETVFPEFRDLRYAMAREVELYFEFLFRENRSILELIDSDYLFVNRELADFYGIPLSGELLEESSPEHAREDSFQRIGGAQQWARGGVLTAAAVLATQSGASRTSPILRGNWIYETILGEKLPNPPPGVPQLPDSLPSGLSERELIEQHSGRAECANCHRLIDPYGFALEQFDAIGRRRNQTLNTSAQLVDGQMISGAMELKQYLMQQQRDQVVRQFCRKLLGFALGREVLLTDEGLLREMQQQLAANEYRVATAVTMIVQSRQFREIRGRDYAAKKTGVDHE